MITKDPVKVRAGSIGARKRWGDTPRVVRLDDPALLPEERAVLTALLALKRRREATPHQADTAAAA